MDKKWTINLHAVKEDEAGTRIEVPLNEVGSEELRRAILMRNDKALRAAGYSPVDTETMKIAR